MHKNVKVLIVVLSMLVAIGYILWLKNRLYPLPPAAVLPTVTIEPTVAITPIILNQSHPVAATNSAVYNGSSSAKIKGDGN